MRNAYVAACLPLLVLGCATELSTRESEHNSDAGVASLSAAVPRTAEAQGAISQIRDVFQVALPRVAEGLPQVPKRAVLSPSDVSATAVMAGGKLAIEINGKASQAATLRENLVDGFHLSGEAPTFSIDVRIEVTCPENFGPFET
jgi:hypothetical protein